MNLPNRITLVRIFLIPFLVFFYLATFVPYGKLIATVIFIIASCTDFLDGHIARKRGLVTDLGKFLDPIADKLLTMSALLLVVADGTIPAPYGVICAIIILGRELVISAFRQIAATKNFVMAADKLGKIKAILTDISMAMFMLLSYFYQIELNANFTNVFAICSYVMIGISVVLTIWSMLNYMIKIF